jgi:spore coat assembly protein SafA
MSEQSIENCVGFQPGPISPNCPGGQSYTVKSGDTMFFIAKRFNVSLQDLINANPQIPDPNTIFPGQVICIPFAPLAPPTPACPGNQVYRVVSGDTMFEIARRYGITLDALITANPQIPDPNLIYPGQEICIPLLPVTAPMPISMPAPSSCNGTLYIVQPGDTLFEIARANNILLATLIAANPQIPDPNLIYPGQTICIPAPIMEPTVPPAMPCPLPAPIHLPPQMPPIQRPMPMPMPPIQEPMPMPPVQRPMPMPMPPIQEPMPMPCMPPVERPVPAMPAPMMPCVPRQGMYPMPVYVVIPWDECPHRIRKKRKHRRCKQRCH